MVCSGLLSLTTNSALSQAGQGANEIPTPIVEVDFRAGEAGEEPEDGVKASIIATIPFEDRCACGARFEAKLKNSEEWVVLGLFAPDGSGDEVEQYSWSMVSNLFQREMEYDIRVLIFDRVGGESAYGAIPVALTPYQEPDCTEGNFANIQKDAEGEEREALIFFSWDKVCKNGVEANRYKIFKNGQYLRDSDEGANGIVLAGEPAGSTWKIEAYGDELPNTNPAIIRNCSEMVTKMNARLNDVFPLTVPPTLRVDRTLQCQVVGMMLRAIIEWTPYTHCSATNSCVGSPQYGMNVINNLSPNDFMHYSAWTYEYFGPSTWHPLFNYPVGSFQFNHPQHPIQPNNTEYQKYAWSCAGQSSSTGPYGINTDPMNQLPWVCPGTEGGSGSSPLTPNRVFRHWVNFDLSSSGGSSAWPVVTEFTY